MSRKIISFLLIYFLLFSNLNFSFADEDLSIIDTGSQLVQESSESGTVIESPILTKNTIPDIVITFQSASYIIDKDIVQDTYHCDLSKDECKVNFDLTSPFGGYVPAKFACINDFSFITGEENKCNPNTIIFPFGSHKINFKIYENDNPSNYKQKSITIINEKEENQIDTNSGSIIESGSGELSQSGNLDIDPETSSGGHIIDSGGQNSSIEIPNVDIEIQSGLEFIDSKYKCKEIDCKVNLNLEKLFTGTYQSNNYSCEWDFGSGTFTTVDTNKKCNPGYVSYGTGNFIIEAKIIDKNNASNFNTGSLSFYNGINIETIYSEALDLVSSGNNIGNGKSDTGSGLIDPETSSVGQQSTSSGGQSNLGLLSNAFLQTKLTLPTIKVNFQSPTYLLEKEIEKNEYICDKGKGDCKVNFDLSDSFSGFTSSKYICHINFPFESTESGKCNPSTITFPIGENIVNFYISDKDDNTNYTSKTLKIINPESSPSSVGLYSSNSTSMYQTKNIIIQSGANKIGDNSYSCNEEKCKINLQYEQSANETCLWDFAGGIYKESYKTTCNPSYVYYYAGLYKVGLKLYQNGNFTEEKSIILKNDFYDQGKKNNLAPIAKIKLQGKLNQDKELIGNKLICRNTKECSVNFDGLYSTDPNPDDKLSYYWDFGNGIFSEEDNPKSIKYIPGKYKIKLKVTDSYGVSSEDVFLVEVYENEEKVEKLNQDIFDYIKITEVLPNPIGKEEFEWIKIKNDSINFVNIKGIEIDDKIGEGSKSYKIKNDLFLLPYQEKKFYKGETKLNLNNSFDEVNLLYNSQIIDSLVWNYEVPEDYTIKKEIKEKVKVIRVIDGDTLVIQFQDGKSEKLRFIGVDTPETKHPKKEVEKFGIEVSDYTNDMLLGKEVFLELDYENYRDKYGRLLGYIWVDSNIVFSSKVERSFGEIKKEIGTNNVIIKEQIPPLQSEGQLLINFNKLLIEKGYARAYLYFPFKYKEEFENAEKEAKKNKLGIWGNDEIKKEMQILEKIEKEQDLENIKMKEDFSLQNTIGKITKFFDFGNYSEILTVNNNLWFLNFSIDKKEIEKERLKEFDLLLKELLEDDNNTSKIITKKQEKFLTYKTSKLKSGLKITGVTFPNSIVKVSFDDFEYKTNSDSEGKYLFLISNNLKVGDYKLDFVVLSGEKEYTYQAPKDLVLKKDYIYGVQDYMVKKSTKKTKSKKIQKSKKKKVLANNNTKKIKYDVKDIKKVEDKSSTKNIIYIFLLSLITSVLGYFIITKKNLD